MDDCQVYWSDPDKLVDGSPKEIKYKVSGANAGGLVGSASGTVTIKNSFAAATVESTSSAGGLVGKFSSGTVTIANSYADCYLKGTGDGASAGGLVGLGAAKLTNCYAAGFIVDPKNDKTAGLVFGTGTTTAKNTYSVVRVMNTATKTEGGTTTVTTALDTPKRPLYNDEAVTKDTEPDTKVRYLSTADVTGNAFGIAFEYNETLPETHVYNLRYKLTGQKDDELKPPYIFPGLKQAIFNDAGVITGYGEGLPHYGDWAEEVKSALVRGLVYYEKYTPSGTSDTNASDESGNSACIRAEGWFTNWKSFGAFHHDPSDTSTNYKDDDDHKLLPEFSLKDDADNPTVEKDGYAMIFIGGSVSAGEYEVQYGAQTWALKNGKWTKGTETTGPDVEFFKIPRQKGADGKYIDGVEYEGNEFILVLLPDEIVTGALADGNSFYQKLMVQKTAGDPMDNPTSNLKTFYFNPHFAKTVGLLGASADVPSATGTVYVRTARHLYDLSRPDGVNERGHWYWDKGNKENGVVVNQKIFSFLQELNIDYGTYTGYPDIFAPGSGTLPFKQDPIGIGETDNEEQLELNKPFVGTYDGGCHVIRNVFFQQKGEYYGLFGLFGDFNVSDNMLKNVVYELDPAITEVFGTDKTRAAGALVGKSFGIVENCAVYGVNMDVTGRFVGGLMGYNQKIVRNCSAEVVSLTTHLRYKNDDDEDKSCCAGGLVGMQYSTTAMIENSYAVGKLVRCDDSDPTNGMPIAGLVAGSAGQVKNSYAAMNLSGSSEIYGLCVESYTSQGVSYQVVDENSGWLKSAFVYRGEKYNTAALIEYKDLGRARNLTQLEDTLKGSQSNVAEGNTVKNFPAVYPDIDYSPSYTGDFPYLTGVRDGSGNSIHYGLWPVPLPVGLAYYEQYKNTTPSFAANGWYEKEELKDSLKKDTDNPEVVKDGYALVFEGKIKDPSKDIVIPVGDYQIKYGNDGHQQSWTLSVERKSSPIGTRYYDGTWTKTAPGGETPSAKQVESFEVEVKEGDTTSTYTLMPLPNEIVTGELSEGDVKTAKYFQELVYGEGLLSERTFYFNPHFAGRLVKEDGKPVLKSVVAGTVADNAEYTAPGRPAEPANGSIADKYLNGVSGTKADIMKSDQVKTVCEPNAISVRTARHFYALSRYQETYSAENKTKTGNERYLIFKRYYFKQELDLDYTTYTWYGNETPESVTPSGGTTYYTQDPIGKSEWRPKPTTGNPDPDWDLDWVDDGFKGIYDGGLLGYGNETRNCHAEITGTLKVMGTGSGGNVHVDGLQGMVFNQVENSSSTVNNLIVEGPRNCYAGGLAGWCDTIQYCTAVVKGSLLVGKAGSNTDTAYGGGLTGGATDIHSCVSIARSVKVVKVNYTSGTYTTTDTGIGYVGSLVGVAKGRDDIVPIKVGDKIHTNIPPLRVVNSYAAAAITADGHNKGSFCGLAPGISSYPYCYYLHTRTAADTPSVEYYPWYLPDGPGETTGTDYEGAKDSNTDTSSVQARAKICTDLKKGSTDAGFVGLVAPRVSWVASDQGGMGFVPGDNAYPYPVPTKDKNGNYYYPSDIWPVPRTAASPTALASEDPSEENAIPESEAVVMDDAALPPEPVTGLEAETEPGIEPEPALLPEDQSGEPKSKSEEESEAAD